MSKIALKEKITEVLEDQNFILPSTFESDLLAEFEDNRKENYTEIEWISDAGEDFIVTVWFEAGSPKSFIREFKRYADEFDVDDHVDMWASQRGENGVPETYRELIEDAESIQEHLNDTSIELLELADVTTNKKVEIGF